MILKKGKGWIGSLLVTFMMTIPLLPKEEIYVTVYNRNIALVKEVREVEVKKGLSEIALYDVASRLDPTSVRVAFTRDVKPLEQNFLYDLVNDERILQKYLGKEIELLLENDNIIKGKLLSFDANSIVLQTKEGNIRIVAKKFVVDYRFPALPEGLIVKPTLQWLVESSFSGRTGIEVSYLTHGLGWHAEYNLVIPRKEKRKMRFASWVSIENNSGKSYRKAKLKVVAGDINLAPRREKARGEQIVTFAAEVRPEAGFRERGLFEYHLYELGRPVDIKDREIKQISLFDEVEIRGEKVFRFMNNLNYQGEKPLSVLYRIANTKENGLGIPLPEGVVRVFKEDIDESMQFVGSDRIEHTSNGDTLEIVVGRAFDVRGVRTILERRQERGKSETYTVKLEVRNRKKKPIEVEILEIVYPHGYVKNSTHKYVRKSSNTVLFPLQMPANKTEVIKYTYIRYF
ncbi:MAG: DUF4139 domain-containing protein [Candidatus Marinimicrobia bacterium]|nr:DUF4139 domain-containing protein [Candidatus Neomarinimicrobiota bacterium]